MLLLVKSLTLIRRTSTLFQNHLRASMLLMLQTFLAVPLSQLSLQVIHLRCSQWRSLQMMMKMGISNQALALNWVRIPVKNLTWNWLPMTRYEFSCSPMILRAYPILLQLANALPRKMIVDLSCSSCKQLQKMSSHKCKAAKAQSGPSVSNSRHAHVHVNMEEIPNEQPGGLSHSSSMMSIESLVQKLSKIYHSLCLIQINLINLACMYSQQENETQSTTSMSLSPQNHKDKLVTLVTATTSATMGITKL